MDFVVVGLGVGALAILLGLTSREAGPRWWPLGRDQSHAPAERARRLAIGRAGRAGGLVLCLAGVAIVVATIIAIGLSLSDQAGAILVMATISLAVLGGVAWATLYVARYHPRPLPRTPGRRAAPAVWPGDAPPAVAGTTEAALSGTVSGAWLDPSSAEGEAESEPGEPAAPLGDEPVVESPADEEGASSEADVAASSDADGAPVEPDSDAARAPAAVEPVVDDDERPQSSGYAISSKNQLV